MLLERLLQSIVFGKYCSSDRSKLFQVAVLTLCINADGGTYFGVTLPLLRHKYIWEARSYPDELQTKPGEICVLLKLQSTC